MKLHPTLRHATLEDVPFIVDLAKELAKNSPYDDIGIDYAKTRQMMEKFVIEGQVEYLALISHDNGEPVGAIFAYAFVPLFSKNKVGVEVFFYVKPEYRKSQRGQDLRKAFEYWANLVGCKHVQGAILSNSPEGMEKFWEHSGYKLSEQVFMKEL
jgi:GNAT superfamily N-acetyltransferase